MLRIRLIEEEIARLYPDQEMRCPVHLSIGQELPAVGICSVICKDDLVMSGHRCHAHYLAKGGDLKKMIAEIYGKETGCSGGKGGSMHLTDLEVGFVGATPIVGSTIPISVGLGLSSDVKKNNRVVVIFFGDGATETGVFHESLNFAILKNIPVLFVCENNLYSVYSPLEVRQPSLRTISDLASGHGIKTYFADGNDIDQVVETSNEAVDYIKNNKKPAFIEIPTYRWREHCGPNFDNKLGYRSEEEYFTWKKKDPIKKLINYFGDEETNKLKKEIMSEIFTAFEFAKKSPFPKLGKNNMVYSK